MTRVGCIARAVLATLMATMGAAAAPLDDVKTTDVSKGELTMEWKMGISRWPMRASVPGNEGATSLGIGYAPTDAWTTELHLNADRPPGATAWTGAIEWENKFLLADSRSTGNAFGILTAIEWPRERGEGIGLLVGPLWQARAGESRINFNALLTRRVRTRQTDADDGETALQYQAQWLRPLATGRAIAVQALGEVGQWNRWRSRQEQRHGVGLAYFGTIGDGGKEQGMHYELGGLLGATRATPRHTIRLKLEFDL